MIARMALQDNQIAPEEVETLENMAGGLTQAELEDLIAEAKRLTLNELLTDIESYEDRFVIAMRAYHMANSDHRLEIEEEMAFDLLVDRFGITPEDRDLIVRVQERMAEGSGFVSEPRLLELHRRSSYFPDAE